MMHSFFLVWPPILLRNYISENRKEKCLHYVIRIVSSNKAKLTFQNFSMKMEIKSATLHQNNFKAIFFVRAISLFMLKLVYKRHEKEIGKSILINAKGVFFLYSFTDRSH